jgi:hypothetical protein
MRRPRAQEHLGFEEGRATPELHVEAAVQVPALGELGRVAPVRPPAAEGGAEFPSDVAATPARLPAHRPAQTREPQPSDGKEVDADLRRFISVDPEAGERRREGGEWIGVERLTGERFDARPGEYQLGAQHDLLLRGGGALAEHLSRVPHLDALVGAKGAAERRKVALGHLEQVDESAAAVGGESDPKRGRAAIPPAADAAAGAGELGGERADQLGRRVELVGGHYRDRAAGRERAAGGDMALPRQRGGDHGHAECDRERRRSEWEVGYPARVEATYEPQQGAAGDDREKSQQRSGIVRASTIPCHERASR